VGYFSKTVKSKSKLSQFHCPRILKLTFSGPAFGFFTNSPGLVLPVKSFLAGVPLLAMKQKISNVGIPTPRPTPNPMAKLLLELDEDTVLVEVVVVSSTTFTTVGSAVTALRKASVESNPREDASPEDCAANVKEPSESFELKRVSMLV